MFWLGDSTRPRNPAELNLFLDRFLPIILVGLLTVAAVVKFLALIWTDGGGDLPYADIPKSLKQGQGIREMDVRIEG